MSKPISTNFVVNAPKPIDSRMQVSTYAELANIPIKYIGLKTYVADEDSDYRYKSTGWVKIELGGSGGGAVWGSITGSLPDQTDLNAALNLKFNKTGGIISGETTVTADLYAYNMIVYGSEPSVELPYPVTVAAPATASSAGLAGQIAYDASYFYVCTATNTWKRVSITTW
jgi:hypothetical protein